MTSKDPCPSSPSTSRRASCASRLVERMVERVEAAGLPRGSLKVEITESQALDRACPRVIQMCHRHGIRVALDDFGTGYSHLTQMHALPSTR